MSFNGRRHIPPPVNEPIRSYAPGSPERAALKARLNAMAAERIDIPLVIGGKEIRTGKTASAVMPHDHRHVLGDYHKASPSRRRAGDRGRRGRAARVGDVAVRGSRGGLPQGRRAADHDLARHDQRRDDARPVEDGVPGRDRLGVRARSTSGASTRTTRRSCYDEQPISRPHDVEPARLPRPRGLRLRGHAVQLHVDRRQPADRAGADGQHGRLEAGVERDAVARTT